MVCIFLPQYQNGEGEELDESISWRTKKYFKKEGGVIWVE